MFSLFEKIKQISVTNAQKVIGEAVTIFKSKVRDDMLVEQINEMEIVACIQTDAKYTDTIKSRIKKAFKESLSEIDHASEADFSFGYSFYFHKVRHAKDLLREAYDSVVSIKEEERKKRIMIVDDESMVTSVLKRKLEKFGYHNLLIAHSGEEALKKIKDFTPDLLTLDINMPKMSGYEVVGRLKGNMKTKDIPIVIMSGVEIKTDQLQEYAHEQAIPVMGKRYDDNQIKKMLAYLS